MTANSAGSAFRTALAEEAPLQCVGVLNAYTARQAHACGYRALYLSGGGVAAGSLGYPDLGMTGLEEVLIDVRRIVDFAASRGKRSFAALLPDNAYGAVVEAAFQQAVARRGGRVVALEKYPLDPAKMGESVRRVAQAAASADSLFIPDGADAVPQVIQQLEANRVNLKRLQLLGTGLWDDPRIVELPSIAGGLYAAPESAGYRGFATRYRGRYGADPVRTATLAYDAVALVAALVKTQGQQRFSEQVLTGSSGFAGIDGIFRFKADGTNERGLAVLKAAPGGGQVVSPAPKSFTPGT